MEPARSDLMVSIQSTGTNVLMKDNDDLSPLVADLAPPTTVPAPIFAPSESGIARLVPSRTSRAILLTILFAEIVVLGFLYVPIPPNPDHEVFDYMAWSALAKGGL